MIKTIQDVNIGDAIQSPRNGKGVISKKTTRTIEATFYNGNKVKLTYNTKDAYFCESDF